MLRSNVAGSGESADRGEGAAVALREGGAADRRSDASGAESDGDSTERRELARYERIRLTTGPQSRRSDPPLSDSLRLRLARRLGLR